MPFHKEIPFHQKNCRLIGLIMFSRLSCPFDFFKIFTCFYCSDLSPTLAILLAVEIQPVCM